MKYSLKSKQFNKKRLNIFDQHPRKSRSRSTSLTPNKSLENIQSNNMQKPQIKIHPPRIKNLPQSLESSVVDQLQQFQSYNNSFNTHKNEKQGFLFESFAKTENQSINRQDRSIATNSNSIKPSQPLTINLKLKNVLANGLKYKGHTENSEPKSESFHVCEESMGNPSRINRFFTESIMAKETQSPQNKVVFETFVRKSLSPQPKSLSPDLNIHNHVKDVSIGHMQMMNKVSSVNVKIEPFSIGNNQNASQNYPGERKMCIMQIPRQAIRVRHGQNQITQPYAPLFIPNPYIHQQQPQQEQVLSLRKRIQEQNLQIQYLKNQKQILESNIELQFSPKREFQTARLPQQVYRRQTPERQVYRVVTPQKYGQPATNYPLDKQKLQQLAQLLTNNHTKLTLMQQNFHNIYSNILNKFNSTIHKSQQILMRVFSQKYYSFSSQLKARLNLFDQKSTQITQLQNKIDVFANTFRSIEQNLRITKLKQYNIELLIQNKHKKSERFWGKEKQKEKEEGSRLLLMENQSDISSIRRYDDNEIEEKDREDLYKLERNIKHKNYSPGINHNQMEDDFKEFDSFLDEKYSHLVYSRRKQLAQDRKQFDQDRRKQQSNSKSRGSSNSKSKKQRHFRKSNKEKSPNKKDFIVSMPYEDIQKINHNKSTSEELEQFSPFQANQMFRNERISSHHNNLMKYSEITSTQNYARNNNLRHEFQNNRHSNKQNLSFNEISSSKNYDFSENSFEVQMEFKPTQRIDTQKEISFNAPNMFRKQLSSKSNTENDDISDTLQGEQERLVNILRTKNCKFPLDCWLDDLGCLRKKNQTYIFDEQGSVIMTTTAAFKKLRERRVFS